MVDQRLVLLTLDRWTAVDRYISGLFVPADPALDAALEASEDAGLPPINVTPSQGKLLMVLAKAVEAKNVLEIGTLGAYSTIWLARALPPDGRLVSLELDPVHAALARRNIARANLGGVIEIRVGHALEILPKLLDERGGPFDLVFIDADKPHYAEYLDLAIRLCRRGALIVADNVVRNGRVVDASSGDEDVRGVRRFNEKLAKDRRVEAIEVQTVGSKGYDGFALVLVK